MSSIDDLLADPTINRVDLSPLELLPDPAPTPIWCPIISVDDHVLEPPELFQWIEPRFRDRAPHTLIDEYGRTVWVINNQRIPITGMNAAVGRPMRQWNRNSVSYNEIRSGTWKVDARVHDMDLNGVWSSLNFPSTIWGFAGTRLSNLPDPELSHACVRAYNDWMIDSWCTRYPDRFIPCQLVWLRDPKRAASDVRENAKRGFRAISFSENPEALGFESIYSSYWDPLFEACEETQTVVNLHTGSSGRISRPSSQSPEPVMVALFPLNGIEALVDWLFAKIPSRFPGLTIALSEAGVSWVPMVIERIGRAVRQNEATMAWSPDDGDAMEILHRNFVFSSIEDPSAFKMLDVIGEDSIMLEADYPHNDSSWPETQALISRDLSSLPVATIRKLCFENAARVYRHPPPPEDLVKTAGAFS